MKKWLALILTCILAVASCAAAWAEAPEKAGSLTVAVTTPLTGNFFTSMWGNGSSDLDVRSMIHGYNLVQWNTSSGVFEHDRAVVSSIRAEKTANGQKYTIVLNDGLAYCDGTKITAWDYAFSFLLTTSPVWEELGANVRYPEFIFGCRNYAAGKSKVLSGVHVPADRMLEVTIDNSYLPFFYQEGLLDCVPYPIAEIAPGLEIADDGDGVYLKGDLTANLLRKSVLSEDGYRTHPKTTSGPYMLVSYEDGKAEFEINPYYKGNSKGKKPAIEKITMLSMASDEMARALKDGTVTLLNKVSDAKVIADCLAMADSGIASADYPRTGLSFISYNADRAPLDDPAVRQAIAYIADRDGVAEETLGGYGMKAAGYYGMGQWMYQLLSGKAQGVKADLQQKVSALKLDEIEAYDRDTEKGAALLDAAGWNLNENGEAFKAGTDLLRYRQTDSGLVPLKLTLAYAQGSAAGPALEGRLADSLKEAGIGLQAKAIDGSDLLNQYYRLSEPEYDMLFLASNFEVVYDPVLNFTTMDGKHVWKTSGLEDEQLWKLAADMRKTQGGDAAAYCRKWLAFEKRFSEILPALPMYTNTYYDFFTDALQDYPVKDTLSWPQAIVGASLTE